VESTVVEVLILNGWGRAAVQHRAAHESTYAHPTGYVAGLPKGGVFLIPVARTLLAGHDYESLIEYESVTHRKYRTRVTLSDLVITDMRFEVVPKEA
jgi:hypothetical protein